jgi:putative peptidoglycan lipid II flippase
VGSLVLTLANVGRDVSLAFTYGTSVALDCFLLATLVPIFLVTVTGGAFRAAYIPAAQQFRHQQGDAAVHGFDVQTLRAALNPALLLTLIVACLLPLYSLGLAGRLPDPAYQSIVRFGWSILPVFLVSGLASLTDGPLQVRGYYFAAAATKAAPPLGIAIGAAAHGGGAGFAGAILGGMVGALAQLTAVGLLLRRGALADVARKQSLQEPPAAAAHGSFRREFLYLCAGVSVLYISPVINQTMASYLGGGAVSAFSYASRISIGVASLFAGFLSAPLLPHFSRLYVADRARLLKHYLEATRLAWWSGFVLAGAVWLCSEPAVALLYQRGQFLKTDTRIVADVLSWLCLQFPALLAGIVGAAMISAVSLNRLFLPLNLLNAAINVLGNLILMHYFGLAGIAIATGLTYLTSLLAINVCLTATRVITGAAALLKDVFCSAALALGVAAILGAFGGHLEPIPSRTQLLLSVMALAVICAAAYLFTRHALKSLWSNMWPRKSLGRAAV